MSPKLFVLSLFAILLIGCSSTEDSIDEKSKSESDNLTISTKSDSNGTVSPNNTVVTNGEKKSFFILPVLGFEIKSVTGCKGELTGGIYTTDVVDESCTIEAEFQESEYQITTSITGSAVAVPNSATARYGEFVEFTINVDSENEVSEVSGCNGTLIGNVFTSGEINHDCVIRIIAHAKSGGEPTGSNDGFQITANAGLNGSITPSGAITVAENEKKILDVVANAGYKIDSVSGCVGVLVNNTFTTSQITENCEVLAVFSPIQYTVDATINSGSGSIVPNTALVNANSSIDLIISPDEGYVIDSVTGCGGSLFGYVYATGSVAESCTVDIQFAEIAKTELYDIELGFPLPHADMGSADETHVRGVIVRKNGVTKSEDIDSVTVNGVVASLDVDNPGYWSALLNWVDQQHQKIQINIIANYSDGTEDQLSFSVVNGIPEPIKLTQISTDKTKDAFYVIDAGDGNALLKYDMETLGRHYISDAATGEGIDLVNPTDMAHDARKNRVLVTDVGLQAVVAIDLNTGNRSIFSDADHGNAVDNIVFEGAEFETPSAIAIKQTTTVVADAGLKDWISVAVNGDRGIFRDIFYDSMLDHPVGIVQHMDQDKTYVLDAGLNAIVEIVGTTTGKIISSNVIGSGPGFLDPVDIKFDGNDFLVVADVDRKALVRVDESGNRTIAAGSGIPGGIQFRTLSRFDIDFNHQNAYVIENENVRGVELDTGYEIGVWGLPSEHRVGKGVLLQDPHNVLYDEKNNRLIVSDVELDTILAIDLSSGKRTTLIESDIGEGKRFEYLRGMAFYDSNKKLLAVEQWNNKLFSVNLSTSGLTLISGDGIGEGPELSGPIDVAYDAKNNSAYVVSHDSDQLFVIDLATGDRRVISDSATGSGPDFIRPMAVEIDIENNRAFMIDDDDSLDALFSVDLTTGDREIITSRSIGSGDDLTWIFDLQLDLENNQIYISERNMSYIVAIDLATGERKKVTDNFNSDVPGNGPWLRQPIGIAFDNKHNRMFAVSTIDDAAYVVDLLNNNRAYISR